MAHSTLPVFSHPQFPQVFAAATHQLVREVSATLGLCDYETEHGSCTREATVHHVGYEMEFCADHFRKVVKRG
jgi:hypothetical protein